MKIATNQLVAELSRTINEHIQYAESLLQLPEEKLNYRAHPDSWSALECLQHLNLYGDFYLPEITNRIELSKTKSEQVFKSGILGNYFANSMLPKEKLNKMKTFADKNPLGSKLNKSTIHEFIRQQNEMLLLLERSNKISLNKVRNSISISKIIKLKLGDTFRFLINHNERHIRQAKRAMT